MTSPATDRRASSFGVDMYWLPMGARGRWLRFGGRVYEAVAALLARRQRLDIFHSVLEVHAREGRFVIEMGPAIDDNGAGRGVVAQGPVGVAWAATFRILRYEVRCWPDGITAYEYAIESPLRLTHDASMATCVLVRPRARARSPYAHVGPRRAGRRRDVDVQLADLVASWPHEPL